jgi:hypothetical protein
MRARLRRSEKQRSSRCAITSRRSARDSGITPPSEVQASPIESNCDMLSRYGWKSEREKIIIGYRGRGICCGEMDRWKQLNPNA